MDTDGCCDSDGWMETDGAVGVGFNDIDGEDDTDGCIDKEG